jgi:gamma-glutamyltranspeptidase/glutathione hydrolase
VEYTFLFSYDHILVRKKVCHMTRKIFLSLLILALLMPGLGWSASKRAVKARNGMVVSAEPHATAIGVEVLKQGGNAIDAAVAVGFALAVTYPQAGNIGGGGFMVIRMSDGRTTTFDYREKAPGKSTRDMFLDDKGNFIPEQSQESALAAGVPGAVAGMLDALGKFGTMKYSQVIEPAVGLARNGFEVDDHFASDLNGMLRTFGKNAGTKKTFSKKEGPWNEGDLLRQPDLAETLERIIAKGSKGFYQGKTADLIVQQMRFDRGLISYSDLSDYRAIERAPVRGTYRGYEILSMAPPSSGGILLVHMLNLLEPYDLRQSGSNSSLTIGLLAEAMKLAYSDRAEFLGDPDFYQVPQERMISKEYAAERRKMIDPLHAKSSSEIGHGRIPTKESEQTTHYSVVDKWGNAVSVTTTINGGFGCGIVVDGAGFFLNNEMDDFSAKPGVPNMFGVSGGEANAIVPQKRMLSSMTPTILLKDGKPFLVVGSPGGSTIITTVLQTISNIVDHGMTLAEAIDAPRIHHQWRPDTLYYEHRGLAVDVIENLKARGQIVVERDGYQGRVDAIFIDWKTGTYYGVSDPRGYGEARGY